MLNSVILKFPPQRQTFEEQETCEELLESLKKAHANMPLTPAFSIAAWEISTWALWNALPIV